VYADPLTDERFLNFNKMMERGAVI
jgi:hypothetical protein